MRSPEPETGPRGTGPLGQCHVILHEDWQPAQWCWILRKLAEDAECGGREGGRGLLVCLWLWSICIGGKLCCWLQGSFWRCHLLDHESPQKGNCSSCCLGESSQPTGFLICHKLDISLGCFKNIYCHYGTVTLGAPPSKATCKFPKA